MSIKPEAFFSDTPPQRIIKVEGEYNVQNTDSDGNRIPLELYIDPSVLEKVGLGVNGQLLSNGARLQKVSAGVIGYATPESLGPRQAATYERSGLEVMQDLMAASGQPNNGVFRVSGTSLTKSDGTSQSKSSDTHDNFMFPRSISESGIIDRLLPSHLASELFAWAGTVRDEGYEFSQKIKGTGGSPIVRGPARRTEEGTKPMIIIPAAMEEGGTLRSSEWAQLEARFRDAPISPKSRFLSLGATSLVLRMAEHPDLLDTSLFDFVELEDPVAAAHLFSKDLTLKETVRTFGNKDVTLIDINEAYATAAAELSSKIELPEDELLALELWIGFCDKSRLANPVEADYGLLAREYDVAARHEILVTYAPVEEIKQSNQDIAARNLNWDRIYPVGGALTFWGIQPDMILDADEVKAGKHSPPKEARVKLK